jgi:glycosyltransferase involved in cell wall biosynthesis
MSTSPTVSVVMTVWNGEKHIAESIDSILRQTYQDLELVIVDDGSTDGTCGVVESFPDPRLRLFRQPHCGIVPSANFGVGQARGTYIARLDADDISLPDRLARQVEALERNPRAVLCYTDFQIFGEDAGPGRKMAHMARDSALVLIQMCYRCPFMHSSVLYRRAAFDQGGGYLEKFAVAEDFNLFTRLIRLGPFVGLPLKLLKYRRHLGSTTFRRIEEMMRFDQEICVTHIQYFLKVEAAQADRIHQMLKSAYDKRAWGLWLAFCIRVLRHPTCWRPEPFGWLVLQTYRLARGGYSAEG